MVSKKIITAVLITFSTALCFTQSITNTYLKGGDDDGYAMQAVSFVMGPTTTGIFGEIKTQETLFPNPASTNIFISTISGRNYSKVEIYNILGVKVMDILIPENNKTIALNVNALYAGVYYCKVYYAIYEYSIMRFVKH